MTKTELRRQQTKAIIEMLENDFGAYNFDNDAGSYFTFSFKTAGRTFEGQLMRNDFYVLLNDSIKLGDGFEEERYERRERALMIEKSMNKAINKLINQ